MALPFLVFFIIMYLFLYLLPPRCHVPHAVCDHQQPRFHSSVRFPEGQRKFSEQLRPKKRFNSKSLPTSLSTELASPVGRLTDHGWALSWCLEGPQETVASPLSKIRQRLILSVCFTERNWNHPFTKFISSPSMWKCYQLDHLSKCPTTGFLFFSTTHRASPQTSSVWGNDSFQGLGGSHPCFLNCSRQRPYRSPGQHKIKELRCWDKTCYWAPSARSSNNSMRRAGS